jgi:DNA-binding NtrC family response regulator
LEVLKTERADLVILDLHLPKMNGLEFLAKLRESDPTTPVIILTGAGSLESAQAAIRGGVSDFLTKPCHLGHLESALQRVRRTLAAQHEDEMRHRKGYDEHNTADPLEEGRPMMEIEREAILASIRRNKGNRSAAALELGISRRTLHYRLAEYQKNGLTLD